MTLLSGNGETLSQQCLEELVSAGLAESRDGRVLPVDVGPGLERLGVDLAERVATVRQAARQVEEAIQRAGARWVVELRTVAELAEHYSALQQRATDAVCCWDKGPHQVKPGVQVQHPDQAPALRRGVHYRVVYDEEVLRTPELFRIMEDSVASGEEARVLRTLPMRMMLRDREEVLIILASESGPSAGLLLRDPRLVDIVAKAFEQTWRLALPIRLEAPGEDVTAPAPDTLKLLALLSAGHTDQAIARELGISERTAARRIAALCDLLGARSRFQLGVQAVRRGLLPME